MKKVLIHACCGVCAYSAIQRLKSDGFLVDVFYFNPNIHPRSEYLKRREVMMVVASMQKVKVIEGDYDVLRWFNLCKQNFAQQEGGLRCRDCYTLRLKETFNLCVQKGYDYYTTTLTISPHKTSSLIIEIGHRIGNNRFLAYDFKKKDGFMKTMEAAKQNNFYRQNYCGCVYSRINH